MSLAEDSPVENWQAWWPRRWWQMLGLPGKRCTARVPRNPSGLWGRCDLLPHPADVDHALERGMDVPRWSTRWTR